MTDLISDAAKDLGYRHIATGKGANDSCVVWIENPELEDLAIGTGATTTEAMTRASEKAVGSYWKAELSARAFLAKAQGGE